MKVPFFWVDLDVGENVDLPSLEALGGKLVWWWWKGGCVCGGGGSTIPLKRLEMVTVIDRHLLTIFMKDIGMLSL